MPALQPQVQLITLEQYEAFSEDKRVEVFDGVVYDMASPSQIHQTISMELSIKFLSVARQFTQRFMLFVFSRDIDIACLNIFLQFLDQHIRENCICIYILHAGFLLD